MASVTTAYSVAYSEADSAAYSEESTEESTEESAHAMIFVEEAIVMVCARDRPCHEQATFTRACYVARYSTVAESIVIASLQMSH